ncbi:phenylalanyl-tRNA synthetase subunit beta [Mycoplasmopsis edwardii]|uniref:Phenylalanyl-tRNA synthetase subunit beta n=1 Tax=Mycoplasmopsis edwardii TaxID=53558 RepID=A0A3B0PQC1_9BACT|nr:hypothetical protein [Mycoplasmopsis edwardii]SYV97987.1 phenylalanyl-tRNA synthetase subunit beta [Mycoplasmopsis edwardii]
MIIVNNISNFYKNSSIIFVNSEVKSERQITMNDLVFFVNSKNEVHSINIQNNDKYGIKNKKYYIEDLNNLSEVLKVIKENNLVVNDSKKFVYKKITKRREHPESNKLFIITLFDGEKEVEIVTNTLDSLEGKVIVVANLGATTFDGTEILKGKVMGVESPGMVVSYKTLGLENEGLIFGSEDEIGKEFIF